METDFRLSRLSIRDFRGIPEIDIELPERMPVYIIGGNNSGKSTVLYATALALNSVYQFRPGEYDYFHDADGTSAKTFTVEVGFSAAEELKLPVVRGAVGNPVAVYGSRVIGRTDSSGGYSHNRPLFNANGENITLVQSVSLKGEARDNYGDRDNLAFRRPYARLDDIRSDAPEVMYLEPQNLNPQLYRWQTGPLKRLSNMLAERFLETDWPVARDDGEPVMMPEAMRRAHEFLRNAVTKFPFWKDTVRPKLQTALTSYIGRQAQFNLEPDIQSLKEWLAQQIEVSFASDAGGATTPLKSMGDGWQSLVRLASLDVLSQLDQTHDRIVLLFEEPETYLHPHLRRKLRDVLERLAKIGWVVIVATHSPEFISFARPQKIVRLWRSGSSVKMGEFQITTASREVRFQEKLEERGTSEFLFAHRIVFCEGKADVLGMRIGLEKLNIDLDALGVTLVDTGSRDNLPHYADIATKLGIPWCGLTDEDRQPDDTVKPDTKKVRTSLAELISPEDLMPIWKGDLGQCLGVPHNQEIVYLRKSVEPKTVDEVKTAHPDYMATCKEVAEWLTKATGGG